MLDIRGDFELSERELRRLLAKRSRTLNRVRRMGAPRSVIEQWEWLALNTLFLWQLRKQGHDDQIAEWKRELA